jgi:hypothetical protein
MIDYVFMLCVGFLEWLAHILGTTYTAINVWIFVVIWPLLTLAMAACIAIQHTRIRKLTTQRKREEGESVKGAKA